MCGFHFLGGVELQRWVEGDDEFVVVQLDGFHPEVDLFEQVGPPGEAGVLDVGYNQQVWLVRHERELRRQRLLAAHAVELENVSHLVLAGGSELLAGLHEVIKLLLAGGHERREQFLGRFPCHGPVPGVQFGRVECGGICQSELDFDPVRVVPVDHFAGNLETLALEGVGGRSKGAHRVDVEPLGLVAVICHQFDGQYRLVLLPGL